MEITERRMVDVYGAESVEISIGVEGELWINVEGVCLFRAKETKKMMLDASGVQLVSVGIPNMWDVRRTT